MGDSIKKYYEEQRFFFDEQSTEIGGEKMAPTLEDVLSREQKETAREKIIEILDDLLTDNSLSLEHIAKIVEIRKQMFKL